MNDKIWKASQRGSFPYNFDVWYACLVPMIAAILYLMTHLTIYENNEDHLKTILLTCGKSVFAYWITDKLINNFKN